MFNFALGVALGAAFAPFWIGIYNVAKAKYLTMKK